MKKTTTYDRIVLELFQKQTGGIKFDLVPIRKLLGDFGNPETGFRSVHVAGTNGKGSTSAMIESVLRKAGYRTGLYTSPHLIDMRERIRVNGRPISKRTVVEFMKTKRDAVEKSGGSFFEILTAMAFLVFRDEKVDIAVVETGLGGRLDATNVLTPEVSVITDIGLEHTQWLGNTLESILMEKAGIVKPGVPCVTGIASSRLRKRLEETCGTRSAPFRSTRDSILANRARLDETGSFVDFQTRAGHYPGLRIGLAGRHQIENASTAILALETMRERGWTIPDSAIKKGLAGVRWPGRLDLISRSPNIMLDSAHNPQGARRLAEAIETLYPHDRLILIFGVLKDKNYRRITDALFPLADRIILTRPDTPRALPPEELGPLSHNANVHFWVLPETGQAIRQALRWAKPRDLICVTGSIFLVGEAMRHLNRSLKNHQGSNKK